MLFKNRLFLCLKMKIVKIVYGMPSPELYEQAERKEVVLGGCCIHEDGDPQWACVECEQAFIKE